MLKGFGSVHGPFLDLGMLVSVLGFLGLAMVFFVSQLSVGCIVVDAVSVVVVVVVIVVQTTAGKNHGIW